MTVLRILSDDLTGALDSAAAFEGEVPVHLGQPAARDAPVQALSTDSRDLVPAGLPARLAPAIDWLARSDIAFKKVDSLLRGNTFAEVLLAARHGRFERVVFAPAFPAQGRLTVGGRLQRASASALADAPTAPSMHAALAAAGVEVDIPDVRTDGDLMALAARATDPRTHRWLWCGSAGLAQALAKTLGRAARPPTRMIGEGEQPLILISASHNEASRRQWALLTQARPQALIARQGDEVALAATLRAMQRPFQVALLDLSPTTRLHAAQAAALLERQLQAIAQVAPRPGVLVVVGGDTLAGLCRATDANGLLASAALRSGWGQARWLGGRWDGLYCHTRSGAFGGEADLVEAVAGLGGPGSSTS